MEKMVNGDHLLRCFLVKGNRRADAGGGHGAKKGLFQAVRSYSVLTSCWE